MMKLINPLMLVTLLFTMFSSSADNTASVIKGEAIIIVDNKTYTLPLKTCFSSTNIDNGKTYEAFIASTHNTRKNIKKGLRFTVSASRSNKKTEAIYNLHISEGDSKGATGYRGKLPYENIKNNKLVFEGKASSIRKENNKPVKALVLIKMAVSCV